MDKKLREKERRLESQLVLVSIYTTLSLALIGVTILFNWELWMIPILITGIISVWIMHISQKFPERLRITYYLVLTLLSYFYYGGHPQGIFGMPIVLFIIMLTFMLVDNLAAIYLGIAVYILSLGYHFFIIHSLSLSEAPEHILRLIFGIVASFIAGYIFHYVILKKRTEKYDYALVFRELENTTRRAEDFLTNVSHELRTPINAVTGITDIMLRNEENPEKRRNLIAIQKAGHRLFSQISDILDYTELDTGKIKISSESYMISSTITDLASELRLLENPNNIELIFDVSPQIPSILKGDDAKIKKIIRHLVDNAFKFTKEGGVYVELHANKKDYGVNLNICVTDTGIGIDNSKVDKIYERFYQVDAGRSRRAGGMGLGLSIVYGLVQEMNGFMHITRETETGTSVRISIPQGVIDDTPCMSVTKNESTCIAAFTNTRKYATPEVREFYDIAIEHLRAGLGVTLHKANTLTELKKIQKAYSLSHIYIGREEYEEEPAYFDSLAEHICVIVVATEKYLPRGNSNIIPVQKPFLAFPITNILENGSKIYMKNTFFAEKRMICPGIRALVVDDDEMNLMVATGILRDYEMEVTTAISGAQAIALCEENSFDIIFMDHMMPDMDGIETMRRLRNIVRYTDENIVIVAFTANAVSGAREMFLDEGFDEFVAKPIETSSFERVLKKVLPSSAIQHVAKRPLAPKRRLETVIQEEPPARTAESTQPAPALQTLSDFGVNTDAGIQYCRGDSAFYISLLAGFISSADEKHDEISRYYDGEDWKNFQIRVHALKSAARTVGLDVISSQAESLENAAKKADISFIKENTETLLSLLKEMSEKLKPVLISSAPHESEAMSAKEPETPPPSTAKEDRSEWVEKLSELKASLDTLEGEKAESIIHEMESQTFNGKTGAELFKDVRAHIQNFDYELAAQLVEKMAQEGTGDGK